MEFSKQLHLRRRLVGARLHEASKRLWESRDISALYPAMLFCIHGMARASVPLMKTAVDRLRTMTAVDPLAPALIEYFVRQIPQENGHDDWLLEDLEALGRSREVTLAQMPSPTVAALVGAQYYWIFHHHPVALLGYILVVESETPSLELIERTVAETGLPREAFRSFSRHAVLESAHNEALDELLDSLPLTREQQGLIGVSVIQTSTMIARAAEEILELHELAKNPAGSSPTAVVPSGDSPEKGAGL
jgi:Iron-containing redox enzyme